MAEHFLDLVAVYQVGHDLERIVLDSIANEMTRFDLDAKRFSVEPLAFDQYVIVLDAVSSPVHSGFEKIFAHPVVGNFELADHQQLAIHCHFVAVGFAVEIEQHDLVAVVVPVAAAVAVAAAVGVVAVDFQQSAAPASIPAKISHSSCFL